MKSILLYGSARESSSRVPQKMIRPFGASSLYEIYLRKFENISKMDNPFCGVTMGISKSDKILWNMSKDTPIQISERDKRNVSQDCNSVRELHQCIKDYEYDYIMWVNGCVPFLKESTIIKIAKYFQDHRELKALICGTLRNNFFLEPKTNKLVNLGDRRNYSTATVKPLIEQNHCIFIYSKERVFKYNKYYDYKKNDPFIYLLDDTTEFLDIDTMKDFEICQAIHFDRLWKPIKLY